MHRFFLRRRAIDPILLSLAIACFPVKFGLDMILLCLFVGVGVYLILGRHRSIRLIDPYYAAACLAYGAVAVAIGLFQGDLAQNIRWIALPVYFALALPLFTGFILVRDPLRQMAIGARAGLLLALAMAIFESFTGQLRIGLGGNPANAAFILCVMAVMARFTVKTPPRYLPNTRLWFYLALIPVVMTGTRSVLPIFLIAAIIDLLDLRKKIFVTLRRFGRRRLLLSCLACLIAASAVAYQLRNFAVQRFSYTVEELDGLSDDNVTTGLDMRIVLWSGAARIFQEHPFVGVSGNESLARIKNAIPADQRDIYMPYNHVHFFILDELRMRGLIGLIFMLGLFSVAFTRIFGIKDHAIRTNTLIFLSLLLFYGSLHGLLIGDRNIAAVALVFTALLTVRRKQELRDRIHLRGIARPSQA